MFKEEVFEYNGYQAIVLIPDNFHGKWIWKTEFFYAFDQAERALLEEGYIRVYYNISDKYGSPSAVNLMKQFHDFIVDKFQLNSKCILFGFSRGGLYAFNFAMEYPECVEKVYLDAPVLDLRTWPPKDSIEQNQMFKEYGFSEENFKSFQGHPINRLKEFFELSLPLLIIAGTADEVVPYNKNAGMLIKYCNENNIPIEAIVKEKCNHHPHSLENVKPILTFVIQ